MKSVVYFVKLQTFASRQVLFGSCFRHERIEIWQCVDLAAGDPVLVSTKQHQVSIIVRLAFYSPLCLSRLTHAETWPHKTTSLGHLGQHISGRWKIALSVVIIFTPGQHQKHTSKPSTVLHYQLVGKASLCHVN